MKNFEEERLREEYEPKKETGLDRALAIERRMKLPAYVFAYSFGIVGALVLGVGMCLAMGILATGTWAVVLGIVIGILGIAVVAANYPLFRHILRKRKDRYASAILVALNQKGEDPSL